MLLMSPRIRFAFFTFSAILLLNLGCKQRSLPSPFLDLLTLVVGADTSDRNLYSAVLILGLPMIIKEGPGIDFEVF